MTDGWSCSDPDMYGYVTCTLTSGGDQTDLTAVLALAQAQKSSLSSQTPSWFT